MVTAYVHRDTGSAWLDVTGELAQSGGLRTLLGQLRRAHRRIPRGIDVVGVDLTSIDEITIDLAVLLCLESRLLGVRNIRLAIALRGDTTGVLGAEQMLDGLQIWRVEEDRLAELSQAAAHARRGEHGWQPLGARSLSATITSG